MHNRNGSSHNPSRLGFISRHLLFLSVGIVILALLYIESQNIITVGFAIVLLLLAHLGVLALILYGGRLFLKKIIHRIHGQSASPSGISSHSHHHADDLETEGYTIAWAGFYDLFTRIAFSGNIKTMMESTVKLAKIQAGEKVLDVGCGTGTLAILAKQTTGQHTEIYGTDAAPEMIERARQKAQQNKVNVEFQAGLVEDIQFPDDTFDLVMNSLMMHHLPVELRQKALIEIYRVLKPGGRLLIVDFEPPKAGLYKSVLTLILGDMTSIDNTKIPPQVEKAGFINVELGATDTSIATYISGVKPII